MRKDALILSFIFAHCLLCHPPLFAEDVESEKGGEEWRKLETKYFTVEYDSRVNLNSVDRRINTREFYVSGLSAERAGADVDKRVALRLDAIFARAKEILDMWPPKLHVKISIFKDRDELSDEYFKIFKKREYFKSFYIYRYNTIYTSGEDISDSVVAHEMGHSIVDHYFSIIPPARVRELLASYVDMHLDEE